MHPLQPAPLCRQNIQLRDADSVIPWELAQMQGEVYKVEQLSVAALSPRKHYELWESRRAG